MTKKLIGLKLEKEYEKVFNRPAPYYDMAAEHKPMKEWEQIMLKALKEGKPYEVEYDPDVLY